MKKSELKDKIKEIIRAKFDKDLTPTFTETPEVYPEYKEFIDFPQLKEIIIDLFGDYYDNFLSSIDWVSPRPTIFRINLKNGSIFYLTYTPKSWVAEIEGKKYYINNLPEEELALDAISRMLKFNYIKDEDETDEDADADGGGDVDAGDDELDFSADDE